MAENNNHSIDPCAHVAGVEKPCQVCGTKLFFAEPRMIITNGREASVLTVLHENAIICADCGSVYNYFIPETARVPVNIACVAKGEARVILPS